MSGGPGEPRADGVPARRQIGYGADTPGGGAGGVGAQGSGGAAEEPSLRDAARRGG